MTSRFLSCIRPRGLLNTTRNLCIRKSWETRYGVSKKNVSSQCLDRTDVKMRLALPEDYDRVIEFMCNTYFKSEPSLVNMGLVNNDKPPSSLVYLVHEQIKEGMTLIAEDAENCLVGAAVNAGVSPCDTDRILEYAECCCERGSIRDIIKFYAYITKEPKLWEKYCVFRLFECAYVGVDEKYFGMGIGRRLVKESWYLARDCGYTLFRIDCTSTYTAKIAESFGWECVFSMPYGSYVDNGSIVFKCVQEPHTEVRVYVDQPLICKDYCKNNPDGCKIGSVPGGK